MLHIYDGYFSAQTFAYKHVPPYWTAKWTCSQARFTSVANRVTVQFSWATIDLWLIQCWISHRSEVAQLNCTSTANRTVNAFAVHWTGRVKITTVPNRTKPNRERSKSRLNCLSKSNATAPRPLVQSSPTNLRAIASSTASNDEAFADNKCWAFNTAEWLKLHVPIHAAIFVCLPFYSRLVDYRQWPKISDHCVAYR